MAGRGATSNVLAVEHRSWTALSWVLCLDILFFLVIMLEFDTAGHKGEPKGELGIIAFTAKQLALINQLLAIQLSGWTDPPQGDAASNPFSLLATGECCFFYLVDVWAGSQCTPLL